MTKSGGTCDSGADAPSAVRLVNALIVAGWVVKDSCVMVQPSGP